MNFIALLVLFLSVILTTFNRGFFTIPGFGVLVTLVVFVFFLFIKHEEINFQNHQLTYIAKIFFAVIYILFIFFPSGIYTKKNIADLFLSILPILLLPIVLTYPVLDKKLSLKIKYRRYLLLLFSAFIFRAAIILISPSPTIDVFTILREAPRYLLAGYNPYLVTYSQVYSGVVANYYPYWPGSFLLQIPFILLFNDPRIVLLIADIATAVLLYYLGKKTVKAEIFSLIYLFRPYSNFIIEQSWLSTLALFLIVLSFYFIEKNKVYISGIALGLMVTLQPYYSLVVPFFYLLSRFSKKLIFSFILSTLIIVTPFFVWAPSEFLQKTTLYYLQPSNMLPIPIHLSLNLNTAYYLLTNQDIPFTISGILGIVSALFIFFILVRRVKSCSSDKSDSIKSISLLGMTLLFIIFYFLFRQAFINYYYFVSGLIILWLVKNTQERI